MADRPGDRERAWAAIRVVDGHNDLAWAHRTLFGGDLARHDIAARQPRLHTDVPRLRRGGVGGQFWSVFVPAELEGAAAVMATLEQIDFVHRLVASHPAVFELTGSADAVVAAIGRGRIASMLGAEGGHSIGESLAVLRLFHRLGVRYLTLTHNRNVPFADSATDVPRLRGLSAFGETVIAEMNRLGMLVDLSHTSAETAAAALDVTRAPVVFSHSSCRALCDHPRNVDDRLLARLQRNGGVIMITFVAQFISPAAAAWHEDLSAELERQRRGGEEEEEDRAALAFAHARPCPPVTVAEVAAHVDHARQVAGLDHIGVGGDFDGTRHLPKGLGDVSGYPRLWAELGRRRWSDPELRQLAGGNVLRTLGAAEAVASELSRG
ncbi:MAG TPA: dipeptidase [Candidatus Micrarchaeia archaeon]|nr:dipeptidase [Candidatus Micrarchaeia archaeon]